MSYRQRLLAAMRGSDAPGASSRIRSMSAVLVPAGVLVSVANPYWIIWWATIGMAYIDKALEHGAAGVGSFFTAHILSDFAWLSLVAFGLVTGRRLMSTPVYRGILMVCGASSSGSAAGSSTPASASWPSDATRHWAGTGACPYY